MPAPEDAAAARGQKRERSRSPSRSPPRARKRPGAGSRISIADRDAALKRQQEREREASKQAQATIHARGVHDVVRQHYNSVPERGREWRKTDSKIKGLRSYNNWVKSCLIQKFARKGEEEEEQQHRRGGMLVLDMGCGKGGDLQKWQSAPDRVELYIGADPADVSINQARERYQQMVRRPGRGRFQKPVFHAEFHVKDCFGEWLGDIPIIRDVGIDPSVGPANNLPQRFGGGGFDIVSMMFCMHYAFESEEKARGMLRNVAGALKRGGRFIGVIPNSDVLSAKVEAHHKKNREAGGKGGEEPKPVETNGGESPPFTFDSDDDWDPEKSLDTEKPKAEEPKPEESKSDQPQEPADGDKKAEDDSKPKDESLEWGNSIYRVKFPGKTPHDGIFRPPYGWKYFYFLEEAVEEVPEYVVPWEAFRALAEDYNLELDYRKPFNEVWDEEKDDRELGPLAERMRVRGEGRGPLLISDEEMEAASFYHAFCFHKV